MRTQFAAVMLLLLVLAGRSGQEGTAFEVEDNQVIFRENGKEIKTVSLKPETPYRTGRGYTKDKVFYDQRRADPEYLLIYRNGSYPDKAHVPPINGEKIEVYDRKGNKTFVIDNDAGKYSGWHLLFSQDWAVVISDDEGMIEGYGFIHMKDKTHKYVSFPAERSHAGVEDFIHVFKYDKYQTGYTKERDVVWVISRIGGVENGRVVITEIAADGSYKRSDVRFE